MNALEAWRAWMTMQNLSDRTIDERLRTIARLLEDTGAEALNLTSDHIISWIGQRKFSPVTRATYHASVRAYCRWLVRSGRRTDDPSMLTPTPKRPKGHPRPVTEEQFEAIVAATRRRRGRAYVLLYALGGLRAHEIAKFSGDDIDGDMYTVTGKGGSSWTLPLHPVLIEEAKRWPSSGPWFPDYTTGRGHVTRHAVSKSIHDAMVRAGVHATPHQLRHYFATALLDAGVPLEIVQQLMRHESSDTTAIYGAIPRRRLKEEVAKLRPHAFYRDEQLAA